MKARDDFTKSFFGNEHHLVAVTGVQFFQVRLQEKGKGIQAEAVSPDMGKADHGKVLLQYPEAEDHQVPVHGDFAFRIGNQAFAADFEYFFPGQKGVGIRVRPTGGHLAREQQCDGEEGADVGRQQDEPASRFQQPVTFLDEGAAVEQVFEDRKGKNASKAVVVIRQWPVQVSPDNVESFALRLLYAVGVPLDAVIA